MLQLIGRDSELVVLAESLERVAGGNGGALLLSGDPGVGKSALLNEAAVQARAAGMRVLGCVGNPASADWAFSGLRELLLPVLDGAKDLLPVTRDALLSALGETTADTVPVQRVALGVLQLLSDAGQVAPVVVIADDVHWLDPATSLVLAFVARRLADDAVLVVAAARSNEIGGNPLAEAGLSHLAISPLDGPAAEALLDSRVPSMPALLRERILVAAVGNPLALTELARATDLDGGGPTGSALPLTERLDQVFGDRARLLPEPARTLLAIMAVNDSDAVQELLAAAGGLTGGRVALDDLSPGEQAGLVWVADGRAGFRHPLMRAAVDGAVTADQRRGIHAVLAASIDADHDRRLWHRALAAAGPDESIAAELERMAQRRSDRGENSTAAVALERAARLSPDPRVAAQRFLAAIVAYSLGAEFRERLPLVEEVDKTQLGPLQVAFLAAIQAAATDGWLGPEHPIREAELVLRYGADNPAQATQLLLNAVLVTWWINLDDDARDLLIRANRTLPLPEDSPVRLALDATSHPHQQGASVRTRIAARPGEEARGPDETLVGFAASCVGEVLVAAERLTVASTLLRAAGEFGQLAVALTAKAWACVLLAQDDAAADAVAEVIRLAGITNELRMTGTAALAGALVAARRGEIESALAVAAVNEEGLIQSGAYSMLLMVQLVRGAVALSEGDAVAAFDALIQVCRPEERSYQQNACVWALTDLMDAAALSGRLDEVRALHAEFTELAQRSGSPHTLVVVAASAPLLADDADAGVVFDSAFASGVEQWPWQHGSLLLAYGRWLRRQRRRTESREPLRAAYALYNSIGAQAWAERAAVELRASGEPVAARPRRATSQLSAQELNIAKLAAEGLNNREIAERLFLSHLTVRNNLYRIFPKLGVSSRSDLARVLDHNGSDEGS
ncbi:DNA-binding CsgD family transcriptional regulator/nucleoside-triphosphatase THEP1 [Actinoplanes lutulentus]|uniref:Regulatory LuxR family protein n=1 Tax=Actinoplanes lutulentus TaxID=1287878 RepID=A0A327Z396_9ACTN|nr:LuxR family transcriptional regulator [Actinoplanes lutulentus]MBB2940553.1 DNA-binding CsgD family transcriptional regulator/nucleoside-triphosphatase THEP1 [Actinoplanes lutulentus]RAK24823.1 regulatory LuxR family protein [Actinoplanes lutulentus]